MSRSKLLSTSILIPLALLLGGATNARARALGPSQSLTQQRNNTAQETQAYAKPSTPPTKANQTPATKTSPSGQYGTEESGSYGYKHSCWLRNIRERVGRITAQGFFSFITAVATAILAVFTGLLVCVTRDLHKATEATLHVGRPFLLVTDVAVRVSHSDPDIGPSVAVKFIHHFYFDIAIKNFGVSPADILDVTSTAEPLDPPKPPDYRDPAVAYENVGQLNDSIVSPGEAIPDRIKASYSCTEEEYTSLCAETNQRIAVYGRIRYRGASDKTFETFFYWWCFLTDRERPDLHRCNTKRWNDHT